MPKVQTTRVFREVQTAYGKGYTTISAQGSSRSGKTWNIVLWLIIMCLNHRGLTVSIVRKALPALKRSVYRDFKDNMLAMGIWVDRQMNRSDFIYSFENGSYIEFFSTDNEQKLRGSKRKILYVNEGNELTFLEWQQLQMRTTELSVIDYNPSFTEDHWICSLNQEQKTYHFISTYKDNPFLEKKVVEEIESLQWKNPSLWRIYGLGLQAVIEGLIFENVDYVAEIPRWAKKKRYIGMDFGYTNDSTAIVEVCIYDNELYVHEICYKTHMLSTDIIRTLKDYIEKERYNFEIISECADPRLVDEIYNAGLNIHPVRKFGGSIMAGITKMLEYHIFVTEDSPNIRKEFKNYTYRQDKEGKWLNEPIDLWNHCFVGSTLITTDEGQKRIDSIAIGDRVLTSEGYRPVRKVFDNGVQNTVEVHIILDNGQKVTIQCTPEHKVKTISGWKKIAELKINDVIYQPNTTKGCHITSTKTKDITPEVGKDCTLLCGKITLGKFPKGIISTIKTETQRITLSKIWRYLSVKNIWCSMQGNICKMKDMLSNHASVWTMHESMPMSGTGQRKAENGIESTQKMWRQMLSKLPLYAYNVAKSLHLKSLVNISSVVTNASHNGAETKVTITKHESVKNAENRLNATNTHTQSSAQTATLVYIEVVNKEQERVYDLCVDEMHEYFANGILVHNCMDAIRYVVLSKLLGGYGQGLNAEDILDIL